MCELFGLNATRRIHVTDLLKEFFSHGNEHPNGWGLAFFYGNAVSLEKEGENSCRSRYLRQRLQSDIESDKLIAHIRLATKGSIDYKNSHPFVRSDVQGRKWTLAHNGTIFDCDILNPYIFKQEGRTDSERILLYLIDRINDETQRKGTPLTGEERFAVVEDVIEKITPENKVNLLIFDGEILYVHGNLRGGLHYSRSEGEFIVSTRPLGRGPWEEVPLNTLWGVEDGEVRYVGTRHAHEYIEDEEKLRHLFLEYAQL